MNQISKSNVHSYSSGKDKNSYESKKISWSFEVKMKQKMLFWLEKNKS